ncbi:hypothetical protein, partial [Acinetobacter indicus]|uniref:hypothetical protein n=1 Tax=Acinetobacter indicus TaxID=756892 RepID=UPI001BC89751
MIEQEMLSRLKRYTVLPFCISGNHDSSWPPLDSGAAFVLRSGNAVRCFILFTQAQQPLPCARATQCVALSSLLRRSLRLALGQRSALLYPLYSGAAFALRSGNAVRCFIL